MTDLNRFYRNMLFLLGIAFICGALIGLTGNRATLATPPPTINTTN